MGFKDFIMSAISDITNAISELQEELENGAVVSPRLDKPNSQSVRSCEVNRIEFDVAIATEKKNDENQKFSLTLFSVPVGIGGKRNWEDSNRYETVSRLKFSIPLIYPTVNREITRKMINKKELNE